MNFTNEQKEKAKSVPIMEYLAEKGFNYDSFSGGEYKYYSPLNTDEKSPSFLVNPAKNVFNDFSTSNKGDVITLCRLLEKVDFSTAVNRLLGFKGFEIQNNVERTIRTSSEEKRVVNQKILPLHSHNLRNYFTNERMIKESVVKSFLSEINYENQRGNFYAACWQNDAGGYELRSTKFKGCLGKKATTSFYNNDNTDTIKVFEGYLDFLSFLSISGTLEMRHNDFIILNSLALLGAEIIKRIRSNYVNVHLYFDNDGAGRYQAERVKINIPDRNVVDYAQKLYPLHKDLNDFLCQKQNQNYKG